MPARLVARSVRGLEWIAADEVATALPAMRIYLSPREIRFEPPTLDERVLGLRTVDDLFLVSGAPGSWVTPRMCHPGWQARSLRWIGPLG